MSNTIEQKRRRDLPRGPAGALTAAVLALVPLAGCTDPDAHDIPPAEVKTVAAYGVTLDGAATPVQVAYVLLRSLSEDIAAAQSGDREAQKAAAKITYSLGAYSIIEERLLQVANLARKDKKTTLGDDREKQLYELINNWAPIVAYYVRSFPKDMQEASSRMRTAATDTSAHVYMDVAHDPANPSPAKHETATLDVELAKEPGAGGSYWRVARVGYMGRPIPLQMHPTTQPVGEGVPATNRG